MNYSSYILKNVDDSQYNFMLISRDMSRLQDYIFDIEEDLKRHNKKCFVLLDLLLNNSIDDRFYKCYFDGNHIVSKSLQKIDSKDIDSKLICLSSQYYLDNIHLFDELFFTEEYKSYISNNLERNIVSEIRDYNPVIR